MPGWPLKLRRWRTLAGGLLAAAASQLALAVAPSVTVEVTGEGDSAYAAQLDASRQAMQRVLPQIVIADRQVQDDQLQERILSSVNGYIEGFKVLNERRSANGAVQMQARVTVSTTAIESFLVGASAGNRAGVSGASIFAEVAREKDNRAFRSTFMRRLFTGYPHKAIAVQLKRLQAVEGRVGIVQAEVEYALRPAFVDAFESGLRALACAPGSAAERCPVVVCVGRPSEAPQERSGLMKFIDALASASANGRARPEPGEPLNCYRLPPGTEPAVDCRTCLEALYSYPVLALLNQRSDINARLEMMVNLLESTGRRIPDEKTRQSDFDAGYYVEPPIWFDNDPRQGKLVVSRWARVGLFEFDVNAEGPRFAKVSTLAFHPVMGGYLSGTGRVRCPEAQALMPDTPRACWAERR